MWNRNARPSPAPSSVSERTMHTSSTANSAGTSSLQARSMPPATPRPTTQAATPMQIRWNSTDPPLPAKCRKMSVACSGRIWAVTPVTAQTR